MKSIVYCRNCIIASLIVANKSDSYFGRCSMTKGPKGFTYDLRLKERAACVLFFFINIALNCRVMAHAFSLATSFALRHSHAERRLWSGAQGNTFDILAASLPFPSPAMWFEIEALHSRSFRWRRGNTNWELEATNKRGRVSSVTLRKPRHGAVFQSKRENFPNVTWKRGTKDTTELPWCAATSLDLFPITRIAVALTLCPAMIRWILRN